MNQAANAESSTMVRIHSVQIFSRYIHFSICTFSLVIHSHYQKQTPLVQQCCSQCRVTCAKSMCCLNDREKFLHFVIYCPFHWKLHSALFSKFQKSFVNMDGAQKLSWLFTYETFKLAFSYLKKACEMRENPLLGSACNSSTVIFVHKYDV